MRLFLLVPLAALAGCGGEGEQKAKAPERAQAMNAGQWQSTFEVTNFRQTDAGRPRLNLPVGTRDDGAACIGEGDTRRPPMELFAGSGFENCRWGDNFYMRNGRLVSSGTCRRDGVGQVEVTISVDFTGTSFEGTSEMVTRLPTDGDVIAAARIEGRRTGACTPGAGDGGGNQSRPD